MTFAHLITRHDAYLQQQKALPYDPVKVQGLGMAFADVWNSLKSEICQALDEPQDEFDYGKWRTWVPRLK